MPATPASPAAPPRMSKGRAVAASLSGCVLALHGAAALAASPGPGPAGPATPGGRLSTDGPSIQRYLESGLPGARHVLPSGRVLTIVGNAAAGGAACRQFVISGPGGPGSSGTACRRGPGVWNLSETGTAPAPVAGRPLVVPAPVATAGPAAPAPYPVTQPYPGPFPTPRVAAMPPHPNPAANVFLPMAMGMLQALAGASGHMGYCPP